MAGLDHTVVSSDTAAVLALRGELDLSVADELRDVLDQIINGGTPRIELDLKEIRFVDSRAIGVLIGAQKRAEAKGGGIRATNPQPPVRKAFDILGLSPVFQID